MTQSVSVSSTRSRMARLVDDLLLLARMAAVAVDGTEFRQKLKMHIQR